MTVNKQQKITQFKGECQVFWVKITKIINFIDAFSERHNTFHC